MQPWMQTAHALEDQFGIPRGLYVALVRGESGGRMVTSPVGAIGPAQLMPATARSLGVDPTDFNQNLLGGAKYFAGMLKRFNNNPRMALAAYNAGPGAVEKYNGVPPYAETRQHGDRILGYWKEQRGESVGPMPATQQRASQVPQMGSVQVSNQINRIQNAYVDAPDLAQPHIDKLVNSMQQGALTDTVSPKPVTNPTGKGAPARLPGEPGWKYLQRVASSLFGLKNDPGDSQTTGGAHTAGSNHYAGKAIDFGNGRNPTTSLQKWDAYVNANSETLGIGEHIAIGSQSDHMDHSHTATLKSSKKPVRSVESVMAPPSIRPINVQRRPRKRVR